MKTLITGVTGFLGQALRAQLEPRGEAVVGVSRTSDPPVDLTDFAATRDYLERERPARVFHLAALSVLGAVEEVGARGMLEANVAATWNLLEACRCVGVGTVVVASSDKQYGALAELPYSDEDTTAFLNGGAYELSKAQQDQVARLYAGLYEIPAVRVARLANLYGPGDLHWSRIVPGTIRRGVDGVAPRLTAGRAGEALREYVFVDDAIGALLALADDAERRGNAPLRRPDGRLARVAFNIGSPHRHAAAEVIATIQALLRVEHGIEPLPPVVAPGVAGGFEPGSQLSESARLKALFPDYQPRSLVQGLRTTLPWYLDYLRHGRSQG